MKKLIGAAIILASAGMAFAGQMEDAAVAGELSAINGREISGIDVPVSSAKAEQVKTQVIYNPETGETSVVIPTGGGYINSSSGESVQAVSNGNGYILPGGQYVPVVGGHKTASQRTQIVLINGKTYVVIPVGDGFIIASTGQHVQAVYNGSGYILPGGQYVPVVGKNNKDTDTELAALRAAVAAAQIPALTDFNRKFWIGEYPAGTSMKQMVADIAGVDVSDIQQISDWFDMSYGDRVIAGLVYEWREVAKDLVADGEKDSAKIYRDIATATEMTFIGAHESLKCQVASHDITEEGDTEYKAVLAQKRDGTWVVLAYSQFPW